MTAFVFSDIVPLSTAASACAISRSASGVAGTIESRLTVTPGRRPAASATAAFIRSSRAPLRSEEHTSELQSRLHLVCRLLLEKKKQNQTYHQRKLQDSD